MHDAEIERLKTQVPAWQVIGERVKLRRQANEWVGLCPFHDERTPSFKVYRNGGGQWLYKCFGCQSTGNVFQFLQRAEGLTFQQAVEKVAGLGTRDSGLAKKATTGPEMVDHTFRPAIAEPHEFRTTTLARWTPYERALASSAEAVAWLDRERGIGAEAAARLHLGFFCDLRAVLPKHPWAGESWMAFPALRGETVISVKLRRLAEKEFARLPKMETALYNEDAIDPLGDTMLVEGEFDALVLEQAGFAAVSVPSAGFILTPAMRDRLALAGALYLAGDTDQAGAPYMEKLWRELGGTTYLLAWPDGAKDANEFFLKNCGRDIEKFRTAVESLKQKARQKPIPSFYSLRESMLSDRTSPLDDPNRMRFPWPKVDDMAVVLPSHVVSVFSTYTGTGKALANGTLVPTPDEGMVAIEKLRPGDRVFGCSGQPIRVLGVFPQGLRQMYRVGFSCGTEVDCDAEHVWAVCRSIKAYPKHPILRTTRQLRLRSLTKSGPYKLPMAGEVEFENAAPLPLHPYVLGALLGDGGFTNTSILFSSADTQILERVAGLLPDSVRMVHVANVSWRIAQAHNGGSLRTNPIKNALRALGLLGHRAETKRIPSAYLFAAIQDRLEVLRGLLDTDGTVDHRTGAVSFSSSSRQLAEDVRWIAFSLGGFACVRPKKTKRLQAYIVSINLPPEIRLFHLERKHALANQRKGWRRVRALRSIVDAGKAPATCLRVDAPDGLFLIKDFIPTHNTTWVMAPLVEEAQRGQVVVVYSAELSPEEYSMLVASYLTQRNRLRLTGEDYHEAARLLGDARFYVGYNPDLNTIAQVLDLMEWAIRRLGATRVVLDGFHFLCRNSPDYVREQENAMQRIKNLAVKYKVVFVVVGQARKGHPQAHGRVADLVDASGSRSFGDDANVAFHLHREVRRDIDWANPPNDILDEVTDVRLQKGRTKGAGKAAARLYFRGDICRFFEETGAREPDWKERSAAEYSED